jgi:transposase-like protein
MARNPVQFQKGLSEKRFRELYGTEDLCRAAVAAWRWPDGFVCPACGGREHSLVKTRALYQCSACRKQTSLVAGTLFQSTHLPLATWFLAIYHLTQSKNGISSIELGRRLGVKQDTAWKLKHKLMQAMLEREAEQPLDGRIEMDDAYLGGARRGGKRGRGAPGKTPFLAAVATSPDGRPLKMKLRPVKGFRKVEVAKAAKRMLAPDATVLTDRLGCFKALAEAGYDHRDAATGRGPQAAKWAAFKWVNTALGNVKGALTGTYRAVRPQHAPRYLAAFAYRFNRRFKLEDMPARLAWVALRTPPMPYRLLKLAEECG